MQEEEELVLRHGLQTPRRTVIAFNRELTSGVDEPDLERLRKLLARLEQNVRRSYT